MIDKRSLERDLHTISKIGAQPGAGVTRLAFSKEERELHGLVAGWLEETGAAVRWDPAGNLIARLKGKDDSLPVVAFGSHLDSVPNGGTYDGVAGVLAAVAVLRTLKSQDITTLHPLEVIAFACEESSRFGVAYIGSKAMCGLADPSGWSQLVDSAGVSLAQAMESAGFTLAKVEDARRAPEEFKAFLELHIEQGRVLEETGARIGIVTSIAAPTRFQVTVTGRADHSGSTPMGLRKDALATAAEVVLAVERHALAEASHHSVGTVGVLRVEPGVMNVVPGKVTLGIDVRGIDEESIARIVNGIRLSAQEIQAKRGISIEVRELSAEKPVSLSPRVRAVLEDVCRNLGIPYVFMPSGAGHDAMYMSRLTDAGMLFIPCRGGISHNPVEEASIEDIALGAEVLLKAVLNLADGQGI